MLDLNRVVLTDTPFGCPFAPIKKPWVGTLLQAAATTFSAIASVANTNSTNNANQEMNASNIDMQRETNALNYGMLKESNEFNRENMRMQNAFNLDMWNKENEYNSPSKQVQRLLAAGINPASHFGSSTGSLASQLTSANAAPSSNASFEAPKNLFEMRQADYGLFSNGVQNAINAYNATRLASAETRNKDALTSNTVLDNTYRMKSMQDSLKMLRKQAEGTGWQADLAKKQLDFYNATMQFDIDMKLGDYRLQQKSFERLEKEMRYQDLQNDLLEITKGYAHQMNNAQIASLWSTVHKANAEVGLINANRLLTDEQRMHEVEKKVGTIIDNGLKGLNLDIQKDAKQAILQSYMNNANLGMWRAYDAWKHTPNGNNRSVGDQFSVDFLKDFMERRFKSAGYRPKFAVP